MEQTECSETSAYKIQTPGNYPEGSIQHSVQGESLKLRIIKRCIWSVALYGSETWTLGKNEEGVVSAFESWSWKRMLKIKWTVRITNDEVFKGRKRKITF